MICFVALMETAHPEMHFKPVMLAFGDLLISKLGARGLQMNRDQLAVAALVDIETMIANPFPWAQHWLAEFLKNPNDDFMVVFFADHCLRLRSACKNAIESTRPK